MPTYNVLLVEQKGTTLVISVNRPTALNAMNHEVITELQSVFEKYWDDQSIGCVILTGASEKAFVAGADINELNKLDGLTGNVFSARGLYLMKTIQNFPRPVIAAINGFALGGGSELALACDIRLASKKARLGQPEVNLGLIPGYGGTQRLTHLVGRGKAMQLMLTGEMIGAEEAHRIGYVDEVYEPEELMPKAIAMAELIASKGPVAVALTKQCINRAFDLPLPAGCALEQANFALSCATSDKNEGTAAFLEKRKPVFKGK